MFTNIDVKFLLIFKFANNRTKEPFVSSANKALVGTLIAIGDTVDIFPIKIAVKAKSVLLLGDQIPFMVQTIHLRAVTFSSFSKIHRRESGGVT